MTFYKPSIIQGLSLDLVNSQPTTNFLLQSLNGSGKTLAFGIPALMRVDVSNPHLQILIIANTRELIKQIQEILQNVGKDLQATISTDGGNIKCQILVTTPNSIKKLLTQRGPPLTFQNLKMIIYDEADELFKQPGNAQAFIQIKKQLENDEVSPQVLLFSATFPEDVLAIIKEFIPKFSQLTLPAQNLKLENVKQFKMEVKNKKKEFLKQIYSQITFTMVMVFVNKKTTATKLKLHLESKGFKIQILTSELTDQERDEVLQKFRKNEFNILISTNILARGIDVPEVDLVVSFDVPYISQFGFKNPDIANYIHRVGRTGRFGTDGLSLTLCRDETDWDLMNQIGKYYQTEIKELKSLQELVDLYKEMRENPKKEDI